MQGQKGMFCARNKAHWISIVMRLEGEKSWLARWGPAGWTNTQRSEEYKPSEAAYLEEQTLSNKDIETLCSEEVCSVVAPPHVDLN